jgi:uncharacterized protein YdeI (BOF family)
MSILKRFSFVFVVALLVVLAACGKDTTTTTEDPNIAKLAEAKTALILGDLTQVKSDLSLPTEGRNGTTISWESDDTDVIGNDGVVTRPDHGDGNAQVTLTATLTLGEQTDTKTFDARVIEAPEKIGGTISGVLDQDKDAVVTVDSAIVFALRDAGYYIADDSGYLYVYTSDAPTVSVGDEVNLVGTLDIYYNQPELKDLTTEDVLSSSNDLPTPIDDQTIADVVGYTTTVRDNYAQYLTLVGFVSLDGDKVYITDGDNDIRVLGDPDAVSAMAGKKVSLNVAVDSYHGGDEEWRVTYADGIQEVVMTPEEKLAGAKGALQLPDAVIADLTLPSEDSTGDVEITWASDNTDVIANDGTITRGETSVEVILTATLTVVDENGDTVNGTDGNPATEDLEITVVVVGTGVTSYANVLATNLDKDSTDIPWYTIEGIVYGVESDGYFVYDGTNTMFVYTHDINVSVGDRVQVVGEIDVYSDQPEFTNIIDTTATLTNIAFPTITTKSDFNALPADGKTATDYGQYVTVSGFVTLEGDYDNVFIYDINSGQKVEVYYNSNDDAVAPFEGKYVTADVILHSYRGDHWRVSMVNNNAVEIDYTDAELLAGAQTALSLPEKAFDDITLPTTDLTDNVSIAWTSGDTTIMDNDGKIIYDGSGSTSVVMTATLTIGDETDLTKDVTVTVIGSPYTVTQVYAQNYPTEYYTYTQTFVTGIVSALTGNGYLIQDTDGTTIAVNDSDNTVTIGDKVEILGNYNVNRNIPRITDIADLSIASQENTVTIDTTTAKVFDAADFNADMSGYANQLIKFDGTIWANLSSSNVSDTSYLRIGTANDTNNDAYDGKKLGLQVGDNAIVLGDNWADSFTDTPTEYTGTIYAYLYYGTGSYHKFIVVDADHFDLSTPTS